MTRLRRDTQDTTATLPFHRPLRILASGTLFLTHTLSLPSHPSPSTVTRAHAVTRTRGGSANTLLSLLAQFPVVEAMLVASLGGKDDAALILRQLEKEGVSTRYSKIFQHAGVPTAWVIHATDTDTRTVINHNPLPDITHEEFVSLLGPLLAPENYSYPSPSASPTATATANPSSNPANGPPNFPPSRTSQSSGPQRPIVNSPAPFDWLHFEGRSVKTTLSNIIGLDGLAKERKWRSHCVFSVDVGRKGRQGVEALIPLADVLFVNKYYAQAQSAVYSMTPRAFLLSLTSIAPPHALLVAHWGPSEGAAVLSLPTKEYFQSSGWVEEKPPAAQREMRTRAEGGPDERIAGHDADGIESVRSGSDFWAGNRSRTSSSAFSAGGLLHPNSSGGRPRSRSHSRSRHNYHHNHIRNASDEYEDDNDNDSQGTETPGGDAEEEVLDEVGAQDAFVAGMIYALSRRLLPGEPYTPSATPRNRMASELQGEKEKERERGRWRLDECLRFATELAGRKARRRGWDGLADEMIRAGWFDN